ncbi:ABC-type transport auxiliary lipoprotein family protein [soil metagenome]
MIKTRLAAAAAVALVGAGALSGCVSLLPKTKPAQLYRFGFKTEQTGVVVGAGSGTAADTRAGVILLPPLLPRPAANDQILTYTGAQAAYVADTRWVAPAFALFQDATEDAFANSARVRLARRTEAGTADVSLRVDVTRFETLYAQAGAGPKVRVSFRATLLLRDGSFGGDQVFSDTETAGDNRVGAIVSAYDAAVTKTLGDLVAWTETQAPAATARQRGSRPVLANPAPAFPRAPGTSSTSTTSTTSSTVTTPR